MWFIPVLQKCFLAVLMGAALSSKRCPKRGICLQGFPVATVAFYVTKMTDNNNNNRDFILTIVKKDFVAHS